MECPVCLGIFRCGFPFPRQIATVIILTDARRKGTRLGPYEIVSAIGAGGMGEIHLAIATTAAWRSRVSQSFKIRRQTAGVI